MPGLSELMPLLWEMDIYPEVEMLEPSPLQTFESRQEAREQLQGRLYVKPDTEEDERLKKAVEDLLVETPEGLVVKGVARGRQGLITWKPE